MAPQNPFRKMPASKPKAPVVAAQPPVILAQQQPASLAPATVTSTALPKMPQAKAKLATTEVVVATPAPARMETHDEFKARTLKEDLAASAAANEAARRAKTQRDFGSGPAANTAPSTPLTADELAAIDEERANEGRDFSVGSDAAEEIEDDECEVVAVERDPEPATAKHEPATVPEKYRTFIVYLTSGEPLEVFYDEDNRMRVVAANGGALSVDEAGILPHSNDVERDVRYHQCGLLGIHDEAQYNYTDDDGEFWGEPSLGRLPPRLPAPVRELDPARVPTPAIKTPGPARPKIGSPPPRRPLPPSATAPSSGLMSSRVGVLPAAEGRPPMLPVLPRSPPATGRDT